MQKWNANWAIPPGPLTATHLSGALTVTAENRDEAKDAVQHEAIRSTFSEGLAAATVNAFANYVQVSRLIPSRYA